MQVYDITSAVVKTVIIDKYKTCLSKHLKIIILLNSPQRQTSIFL